MKYIHVSMSGQNVCMYTCTCVCVLQLFAAAYPQLHTKQVTRWTSENKASMYMYIVCTYVEERVQA